jgi:hypothetical protein
MLRHVIRILAKEVSGESALSFVSEISRHHRIQASPGLRAAAEYAAETLSSFGLEAQVLKYRADYEAQSWGERMFEEWSCRDAELRLTEPAEEAQPLARWSDTKFSLIQRSHPTPGGCCDAEVVALEKGEEDADYEGVDVSGKIVITSGDVGRLYEMAVERRGALGIIYDGMRTFPPIRREGDLDDALQYTSFWWTGGEKPCFGFVLSPRRGRWLRRLVEERRKKGEPVKVWAKVDSRFRKGTIEDAVATIRGETDEEVVVVAHICHPQPSANDNASGCGAAIEAARALHRLIARGDLPRPRRTIRFTLVPEMTGTYTWLAGNEDRIPKMVAAINLDMVGENQNLCGGPLVAERTPEATPSFVNALVEAIYDELKADGKNLAGTATYALFKHAVSPFSGGSDHYIYSDPTVGIPCPMFIQWPDKFYHTSWDTIDKVDPEMLRRVALMTATYAYFIANAGAEEAVWLATEVSSRAKEDLVESMRKFVAETLDAEKQDEKLGERLGEALLELRKKVEYRADRGIEAIGTIGRLAGGDPNFTAIEERLIADLRSTAVKERKLVEQAFNDFARTKGISPPIPRKKRATKLEKEAAGIVPSRVYRGPISTRSWTRKLSLEERDDLWRLGKEHRESEVLGELAVYWTDGARNLLEIGELVRLETGRSDLEYLVKYYRFLEKMGLVKPRR